MAIEKPPLEVEQVVLFRCPICKAQYANEEAAEKCLAKGVDAPIVKVGDIVNMGYGYGWFDGDIRWVMNPNVRMNPGPKPSPPKKPCPKKKGSCFDSCCTMGFYYVVTAIDCCTEDPHRTRYHVFTKAMTGGMRPKGVYTFGEGSGAPQLIKKPSPFVIKDSKGLIGQKGEYLI